MAADIVYCDFDKNVCAWTENLVRAGEIPHGEVWCKSIKDIKASEVRGLRQFHVFNGISGWPLALKLAEWPKEISIITGSAPCQSFSAAGKKKGFKDKRHLWPDMFRIIQESHFDVAIGEQVPGAIGMGWLDGVFTDLEKEGYACGAVVLPACSVGAAHIRQRLYWVAERMEYNQGDRRVKRGSKSSGRSIVGGRGDGWLADSSSERCSGIDALLWPEEGRRDGAQALHETSGCGEHGWLADTAIPELRQKPSAGKQPTDQQDRGTGGVAFSNSGRRGGRDLRRFEGHPREAESEVEIEGRRSAGGMANNNNTRFKRQGRSEQKGRSQLVRDSGVGRPGDSGGDFVGRLGGGTSGAQEEGYRGGEEDGFSDLLFGPASDPRPLARAHSRQPGAGRSDDGEVCSFQKAERESEHGAVVSGRSGGEGLTAWNPWSDFQILPCTDGKSRRTGRGVFPLAHGLPRSVGQMQSELQGLAELAGLSTANLKAAKSNRLHRLKGYGNAIVPWLAAQFIRAYMEARGDMNVLEGLI
jgi:DNA (cytosine-5)-methyltransferase 1